MKHLQVTEHGLILEKIQVSDKDDTLKMDGRSQTFHRHYDSVGSYVYGVREVGRRWRSTQLIQFKVNSGRTYQSERGEDICAQLTETCVFIPKKMVGQLGGGKHSNRERLTSTRAQVVDMQIDLYKSRYRLRTNISNV